MTGLAIGVGAAAFPVLLWLGLPGPAYAVGIAALTIFCIRSTLSASAQIGIGAGLALVLYTIQVQLEVDLELDTPVAAGRVFIAMLKMLIAPMILFSIAGGIAGMRGVADLGRLGARTITLYVVTMALAVVTGLVFVNAFEPGAGLDLGELLDPDASPTNRPEVANSLGPFLLETVFQALANPLASISQGRILPIVVFSVLFGLALLQSGERAAPLVDVILAGYAAVMRIIGWFLVLAPVGVFAILANLLATIGFAEIAEKLGVFSLVVFGATLFHAVVTLPAVARVVAGVHPMELFRGIREALVVSFTTSSSAATLPVTTRCVEENLGVPKSVSSFVLPLGATVNMDGTALYEAIAALFVATLYGVELSIGGQLVVFLVAMLTAIGAPGIPSAGMVTMIVVLEAVGLPAEAVGILLPIDRALDTVRTMANVEGDAVVAVSVARSS